MVDANVADPPTLVHDNPHVRQVALAAARPLGRLDRHLVSGSGIYDDVAGDVRAVDATIAPEPDLAREMLGLLAAPVARLIRPCRHIGGGIDPRPERES